MSKPLIVVGLAAFILAIGSAAAYAKKYFRGGLVEADLTPGAWYCYYLGDHLTDYPDQTVVRSAIVQLPEGDWLWATDTPEWDRTWFAEYGWEFPSKWVPYAALADMNLEMGSVGGVK